MALTTTPNVLPVKTRPDYTINQTVTITSDNQLETITSVSGSVLNEPNIIITGGVNSVNISGTFNDPFNDIFYYIDKGESSEVDNLYNFIPSFPSQVPPIVVQGLVNLPPNKELFSVIQDTTNAITVNFNISVVTSLNSYNIVITQRINNSWDGISNAFKNYY